VGVIEGEMLIVGVTVGVRVIEGVTVGVQVLEGVIDIEGVKEGVQDGDGDGLGQTPIKAINPSFPTLIYSPPINWASLNHLSPPTKGEVKASSKHNLKPSLNACLSENKGTLEILRTSPDFAVINKITKEVRLIEVKYLHHLDKEYVYRYASRMAESWNPSFLFLATQDRFYFGEVGDITEKKGEILPLNYPQISKEIQEEYLKILRDFEANN
jgi:hypothetical protein